MSILINKDTRVLVQGITGRAGSFHAAQMREYGTQVIGGVTPGRGGTRWEELPVFDTVAEAVRETGATATCIFVPARFGGEAILEAAKAHLSLIVVITEGIPALDMVKVKSWMKGQSPQGVAPVLIGPNGPGLITPGQAKIGIMPGYIHRPGSIGVVSRSGTLTYEAVWQLTQLGLGQSTCVGIGGDTVPGTSFVEILELFERDRETAGIVLIGEIGGTAEEEAAVFIRKHVTKPVVAFVAGATAPREKRMGHAGAVIAQGQGTHASKIQALKGAEVAVAENPASIGQTMLKVMNEQGVRRKLR
ncbi:MAG: succinate--CoA ligase subunit alpha [Candidatus Omnitrophica bacterium]|nr:succinate--CoA ligase subunit alpha [Candidatus Omnitrophota bacterium]